MKGTDGSSEHNLGYLNPVFKRLILAGGVKQASMIRAAICDLPLTKEIKKGPGITPQGLYAYKL
jgi:hypothetical protein